MSAKFPGIPVVIHGNGAVAEVMGHVCGGVIGYPITPSTEISELYEAVFGAGDIRLHGCRLDPPHVEPGRETFLSCDFEPLAALSVDRWIFVHVEGLGRRHHADHQPVNGLSPMTTWKVGSIVRDVTWIQIPDDWPPGEYHVFLGVFLGNDRLPASPPASTDGNDRVLVEGHSHPPIP